MSSIIDSIHYKPMKITFIDIGHSYDCQKDIRVLFHLPETFVCGTDDKIVLHKDAVFETTVNDLKVDVKTAKYYKDINGSFCVIFSADMLSGIINDSGDEYRFLFLNTENEIIGASSTFKFMQNSEIPLNTASIINDNGYIFLEESPENQELIKSLKKENSDIKDMFKTFYTQIQSGLLGKSNYLPFEKYIAFKNIEKEKEINSMIDTLNKQKKNLSDIVLSEIRTMKDDICCKITQENNTLCYNMKNLKKEELFDKKNIGNMTNIILSKVNESLNPKLNEILEKVKEIHNRLQVIKSSSDEKIQDFNLNINNSKLQQILPIPPVIRENKSAEPIFSLSPKNLNFEIINAIDLGDSKIIEENSNIKKDENIKKEEVYISLPQISNEIITKEEIIASSPQISNKIIKKEEVITSSPRISNEITKKITILKDAINDKKDIILPENIKISDIHIKKEMKENNQIIVEPSIQIPKKNESLSSAIRKLEQYISSATCNQDIRSNNLNMKPGIFTEIKKADESSNSNSTLSSDQKKEEAENICPVCFIEFQSKLIKDKEFHVNSHFRF